MMTGVVPSPACVGTDPCPTVGQDRVEKNEIRLDTVQQPEPVATIGRAFDLKSLLPETDARTWR